MRLRDFSRGRGGQPVPIHAEPLYHVMDGAPGIHRTRHPVELLGVVTGDTLGFPKYVARSRGSALEVTVDAPVRARARLKAYVERELPKAVPQLAAWPWRLRFAALPDRAFKP